MVKLKMLFLAVLILALTSTAMAEQGKIGFVDLQKALNESLAGKKAKAELEAMVKERQATISEKVKERDKLREELTKQSAALSEKARKAKADELDKLEKAVERLIADSNEELQKKQREKESQIIAELEKIITKMGKDEGYSVILPADVILYAPDEVELTNKVIKLFDESYSAAEKKEGEKGK